MGGPHRADQTGRADLQPVFRQSSEGRRIRLGLGKPSQESHLSSEERNPSAIGRREVRVRRQDNDGREPLTTLVAGSIGECIHIAGVLGFLELAGGVGFKTRFLGQCLPVPVLLREIENEAPCVVGLGYRLSPEPLAALLEELRDGLQTLGLTGSVLVFGGPPSAAEVAKRSGLFDAVFDGSESVHNIEEYLRGVKTGLRPLGGDPGGPKPLSDDPGAIAAAYPQTLLGRIRASNPLPIVRHHFGRPTLEETLEGVRELAESKLLDVISLGPDQSAQEHFFQPERMYPASKGAGGVPIRSAGDLRALYRASRTGNFPLMRCYSGTRDQVPFAELLAKTINLAWGAVPLMWYNEMDGRSDRPLQAAVEEAREAIAWHVQNGIPVEVNEAHQWSLRSAHDSLAVAMAFISALAAKRLGVRHYICQLMFNTPPGISPRMDLAKMLAKMEVVQGLREEGFEPIFQTRAGIASLSPDPGVARGQLACSVTLQMCLAPQIVHVVAHSEGSHLASAAEIIEAVKIASGAIRTSISGMPDPRSDPAVLRRKEELVSEAWELTSTIADTRGGQISGAPHRERRKALPFDLGTIDVDALIDPDVLYNSVRLGLLDAPGLAGNLVALGRVRTRCIDGAWQAVDPTSGRPLREQDRIRELGLCSRH